MNDFINKNKIYILPSILLVLNILAIIFHFFIKIPFPPKLTIPMYLLASYYLQNHFDFSYLDGILSFLGEHNDKFSTYTDNADVWFDNDAKNAIYDRNSVVKIIQTLGECSLIYLGYRILQVRKNKQILFFYNLFVIGAIFSQCFYSLEILRRMGDVMYWYWAFPLAYVLYYKKEVFTLFKYKVVANLLFLTLLFFGYDYLKYLFMRPLGMYKFIWDM